MSTAEGAPQPRAESKSIMSKGSDFIANNSTGAMVFIVVLVLVIVFLFARQRGWFGLGDKGGPRGKRKSEPDDDSDPETDSLIASINGAAGN